MKLVAKIIIIIAVFFAGYYVGTNQLLSNFISLPRQPVTQQETVSLMFDFGNGEIQTFSDIAIQEKTTVFEMLKKITEENNLEFSYKDYGGELGAFVESINNMANNPKFDRFWQYWINNQYAQVGASQYQLQSGDVVEWKYTKGQIQ